MEQGRINQLNHNYPQSIASFKEAIDDYEYFHFSPIVNVRGTVLNLGSYVLNDAVREYRGSAFEEILAHHFQAYNYLAINDYQSAEVEIRNIAEKQAMLLEEYEGAIEDASHYLSSQSSHALPMGFQNNGQLRPSLANSYSYYFSAVFWEAQGNINEAMLNYKKAYALNPNLSQIKTILNQLENRQSQPQLIVIAEQGLISSRRSHHFSWLTRNAGAMTIALPELKQTRSQPIPLQVAINQRYSGITQTIEDFNALASQALKAEYPFIMLRQVIRAMTKYNLQNSLNEASDNHPLINILASTFNLLTEQSDLRAWSSLPENIQIHRTNLDFGRQIITLSKYGQQKSITINPKAGEIILVRAIDIGNQLRLQTFRLP